MKVNKAVGDVCSCACDNVYCEIMVIERDGVCGSCQRKCGTKPPQKDTRKPVRYGPNDLPGF